MLNYLVKHSRLDLGNPVRELSKGMSVASIGQYKELLRVIAHTLEHDELGLRMKPNSKSGVYLEFGF